MITMFNRFKNLLSKRKRSEELTLKSLTKYMNQTEMFENIYISLKNKYIYFETAKAACTTVKRTLMNFELVGTNLRPEKVHLDVLSSPFVKPYQLSNSELIKILDSDKYLKFCFVRNPYVRILSCYLDKIEKDKAQKKKILKTLGLDVTNINMKIHFDEFVDAIAKQKIKEMDKHWRVQYYLLFGGDIKFDYIGKVESFKEDIKNINALVGGGIIDHYEKVVWHETNSEDKLSQYYTYDIAKKVYDIYKIDFEKFKYNSDLENL